MAVTNTPTRNASVAVAAATVFPYGFKILDKADLYVSVNGAQKTVDIDFTVDGVGNEAGGNVTFIAPMLGGEVVVRKRAMIVQRLVDFQNLGDLRSATLNNDQDAPIMMLQQLAQTITELIEQLDQDIENTTIDQEFVFNIGTLRYLVPIKTIAGTAQQVDKAYESALSLCTNAAPVAITLRANTGDLTFDLSTGAFLSFRQTTVGGQVTIAGGAGVTVVVPAGYLPKTRGVGSIITATCEYAGGAGAWVLSGDLAFDPSYAAAHFGKALSAAHSNSTITPTTPAGFTANVTAGKTYRVRAQGTYQTAATTTGCILGILGAGGVVGTMAGRAAGAINAAAAADSLAVALSTVSGAGSSLTTTGVSAINTPHWLELEAVFMCTTSGTLALTFASEVAASAAQLNPGFLFTVDEVPLT